MKRYAETLVNMQKDNIAGLQSTRCNEVWNRICPSVQGSRVQASRVQASRPFVQSPAFPTCQNQLQCKNKIRNSKEVYKRATKENSQKTQLYFRHILNWRGLEYRNVMEISKFQQVGFGNRETEKTHNDEAPMFDEVLEDREIREKIRIMRISSRAILSANFYEPTFHRVSVSFHHV